LGNYSYFSCVYGGRLFRLIGDQLQGQEQRQADQQQQIDSNQAELDRQRRELERLKQQAEY